MPPYAGATLQQNDASCARHAHSNGYTTQIDGEHFTAFRTTSTKSRLNFLSLLRGSYQSYVLNDAAFEHLKKRKADPALVARLATRAPQLFPNQLQFLKHLVGRKINVFDKLLIRMLGGSRHLGINPSPWLVGQCGHCLRRCRPVQGRQSRLVLDPRRAFAAEAHASHT